MTRRDGVATYKALKRNSNGIAVMKVIKKSKRESDLHTSFKELENCDSPYVVRYIKCREDENKYRV